MDELALRMLRSARQSAFRCGLEPFLKQSRTLTRFFRSAYNKAKPDGIAEIALPGYSLRISASDASIAYSLLTLGAYEPFESSLFADAVRRGCGDVIDIGAHVGYYALMAATTLGSSGKVWAIEPHPVTYGMLEDNVAANRLTNIECINAAASERAGTAELFVAQDGNTGGHSLAAKPGQSQSVTTRLIRVDDVVPPGTRVSIVKMDTEGAEVKVLRGMERVLTENRPTIFTEFFPAAITRAGETPGDMLAELMQYGYELAVIDDDHRKVARVSPEEIIETCPAQGALNLLCTRSDA